jgi:hypothetical protein
MIKSARELLTVAVLGRAHSYPTNNNVLVGPGSGFR